MDPLSSPTLARCIIGASFVEFKAMQAFAGICYLRYLRRNLEPSDLVSVQAIFRSAKAAITAFLELPDSTVVHLPGPSFLTVWYCLLIMAKLTMLAPQNALGDIDALGRSQTRQVTLAVVNRLQLFSRGEDWWATSARMAQLVPWLEEYTPGAGTREATVTMPCPSDGPTPADRSTCCDTVDRSASYEPCAHVATTEAVPPETTTAAALESCYTPLQPSGEHELDGLLWDEPVWQQMIADFAQHPNAWVFDLGGANTPL
ncbi:hypothetical protein GQ53DRAFT_238248 [Thozetella sp. PMI_491]|nr:hypothetical protein GQ53DRAFT_238248 [Thozetella sp. PMI_491]